MASPAIHLPYTLQTYLGMVHSNGLPDRRWFLPIDPEKGGREIIKPRSARVAILPTLGLPGKLLRLEKSLERLRHFTHNDPLRIERYQDYAETDWTVPSLSAIAETAIACLRAGNGSVVRAGDLQATNAEDAKRFVGNVVALQNPRITAERLLTLIRNRGRLDLEQAAGAVVAAFVHAGRVDDACALTAELTGVLAVSHMTVNEWEMAGVARSSPAAGQAVKRGNLAVKVLAWASSLRRTQQQAAVVVAADSAATGTGLAPTRTTESSALPTSPKELVELLLRVRRVAPRDRCLHIPRWLFEEAGVAQPAHQAEHNKWFETCLADKDGRRDVVQLQMGSRFPSAPAPAEDAAVVLSRAAFRAVQRRVMGLFRFWAPDMCLAKNIHALQDEVLYSASWIDEQMRETDDVALVGQWLFAYQRRLQRKVVSDDQWTRFLEKGEGSKLYQNNLSIKSTFEEKLESIAGQKGIGGNSTKEEVLMLMDKTCLLMKSYVDVHGAGDPRNLILGYKSTSGRGRTDRGPVDQYNLLCTMLYALKEKAREAGLVEVPGKSYKFLARDIMHWNRSWRDDAFAGGKIHGWETWIVDRGLAEWVIDREARLDAYLSVGASTRTAEELAAELKAIRLGSEK